MRIIFTSLASPGHTYPMIPLALAARDAGHQVRFATSPSVHPTLTALGLTAVPAGVEMAEAFGRLRGDDRAPGDLSVEETMDLGRRVFGDVMPRAFAPDLIAAIDDFGAELVVKELGNPGAAIAAQARGLPSITHGFGLVGPGSGGGRSPFAGSPTLVELAAEHRVDALRPITADPYVDLCPPGLRDPAMPVADRPVRVPMRPSAFRTPQLHTDLGWRDGRPLLYLTLGTAFGSVEVLRQAVEGLSRLDVAVLVATGPSIPPGELGGLPDNVRAEAWVQQPDVLAEAAVVVHHGGSGTTLGATAAGVVQLLLPQGADQFMNAAAVVRSGAGLSIERAELSPERVVERIGELLGDGGYRDTARRLSREVAAMPSPAEVAARLPELADLGR